MISLILRLGATVITLSMLLALSPSSSPAQQTQFPGSSIPQFVDPLPTLPVLDGTAPLELHMREVQAQVLSTGTFSPGVAPSTWVWSYIPGAEPPSAPLGTYVGPFITARRGVPTEIKYVNDLGSVPSSNLPAYTQSTDQTIHWADPANGGANQCSDQAMDKIMSGTATLPDPPCNEHYQGSIPTTVHLHGGEVPAAIDGGPDSWFTSDGLLKGSSFYSKDGNLATNYAIYRYPNSGQSEPLWFHDHTLGVTRLNVYAGLAGLYLLTDPANDRDDLPPLTPLVIQDRMFDTNGQLFFPAGPGSSPTPDHPFWVPEFFGDAVLVNGRTWPFLTVEPKRYRFLILNASNSRAFKLRLTGAGAPPMWQTGTDGGFLDRPVKIGPSPRRRALRELLLMPAERAEIIIDFAGMDPGSRLILTNTARAPYSDGDAPDRSTTGRVMQFRVVPLNGADRTYDPASRGALRKPPLVKLVNFSSGRLASGVKVQKRRQLTLNELMGGPVTINGVEYPADSLGIFLNNTRWDGQSPRAYGDFTPITAGGATTLYSETGQEGETEVWEIVNLTGDAHPIHLHLIQFQILNRQTFRKRAYTSAYNASFPGGSYIPFFGPPLPYEPGGNSASGGKFGGNPDVAPYLAGRIEPAAANEAGWKDTVLVPPGKVTRLAIRWAPAELPATTPPAEATFAFVPNPLNIGYVWHCHILDHEDNEMMRPFFLNSSATATRTYVQGVDY